MNILRQYPESMSDRDAYRLTKAVNVNKMQSAVGSVITPQKWVEFEDTDTRTGDLQKVLVIEADNELFATVSRTFIEAFDGMVEYFGSDVGEIKVIGGKSKAGREYITCEIV